MEFLVEGGRMLALFGLMMIILGIFYMPDSWHEFLVDKPARLGIALSGVAAIIIGFFLAAIGG